MKNNPNPVAIGMFVLGAAIIAVAAVMIFGAAKFFAKTEKFVSYFSESVNGLDVGAPLKYKGVTLGRVETIRIASDKNIKESSVAVIYSIDLDLLKRKTGETVADYDQWIDAQIEDGMRAKLNYQSIVTGMLYVELDFFAEKGQPYQLKYSGIRFKEIPSSKSNLSEIAKSFQETIENISKIDFNQIASNANAAITTLNAKLSNIDTRSISEESIKTLRGLNALIYDPNLKRAISDTDDLVQDSREFLSAVEKDINRLVGSATNSLSKIDSLVNDINSIVSPQSPMRFEVATLLRSLNETLNSLTNFTEYLQRNPSSLITGKALSTHLKKE